MFRNFFAYFVALPLKSRVLLSLGCCLFGLIALGFAQKSILPKRATSTSEPVKQYALPNANGATAALQHLFVQRYKSPRGSHLESVLSALGASAGFGSQMAVRELYVKTGRMTEQQAFFVLEAKNGQKYFYGELLNKFLLEDNTSVRSIVYGGASQFGAKDLPNYLEIAKYNATILGTDEFGHPRLPADHQPIELPVESLQKTWPTVRKIYEKYKVEPQYWGAIAALAAQRVMLQTRGILEPSLATKVVMESAMPMSKVIRRLWIPNQAIRCQNQPNDLAGLL